MQQCSDNVPPVIRTFIGRNGNEIEICYPGTWADLCRNYVNRLPQNATALQGGNHAIAEDCTRRLPAVGAGHVGGVGAGVRGSEAGQ
jgi:hypothetical protein